MTECAGLNCPFEFQFVGHQTYVRLPSLLVFIPVNTNPPNRPWREIARELAHETDRNKISELLEQLNRALEEQGMGEPPDSQTE